MNRDFATLANAQHQSASRDKSQSDRQDRKTSTTATGNIQTHEPEDAPENQPAPSNRQHDTKAPQSYKKEPQSYRNTQPETTGNA